MTTADPTNAARPLLSRQWLPVLLMPALCLGVGSVFLPRPQNAMQDRASVDRTKLHDVLVQDPAPQQPMDVTLGGAIRVRGGDLPTEPRRRGRGLGLAFYFEALKLMDRDWQVFVHIDREGNSYRIHGDHWPARGRYPTTLWQPGEIVRDTLDDLVPIDAPPGTYEVYLGFYIGDDRLPFSAGDKSAHDGSNRVRVGRIVVE